MSSFRERLGVSFVEFSMHNPVRLNRIFVVISVISTLVFGYVVGILPFLLWEAVQLGTPPGTAFLWGSFSAWCMLVPFLIQNRTESFLDLFPSNQWLPTKDGVKDPPFVRYMRRKRLLLVLCAGLAGAVASPVFSFSYLYALIAGLVLGWLYTEAVKLLFAWAEQ